MLIPKNILVVRSDRVGDVVLTVPAIRVLKQTFPQARISVWLNASTKPLLDGLPFIDEILVDDKARSLWGSFSFIGMLRRKKFDLAVIYHTKQRTNLACALAGIPQRLGYKDAKHGWLLTHRVEDRRHFGEKHEAEFCLDLLPEIGVASRDLTLELARAPEAERWADAFVATELNGGSFIAVHPGSSCPTHCWPSASFAKLIGLLKDSGSRIIIVGTRDVTPLAREISAATDVPVLDMTGKTTLAQLVSLFRRSRAVISNDSGPVHVAAGVGAPVLSIFLRDQPGINPERWKPLGIKSRTVVSPPGHEIILDCNSRVISGSFDAITPEQVLKSLHEII